MDAVRRSLEVLGLGGRDPRRVTEEEVRRAFRREALLHHPDRNPAAGECESTARFQDVSEAHQILLAALRAPPPPSEPAVAVSSLWELLFTGASASDRSGRSELARRVSLGFHENPHPVARAIRADNPTALGTLCTLTVKSLGEDIGLGNTALHFVAHFRAERWLATVVGLCDAEALSGLLKHRNGDGLTPVDVSRQQCHFDFTDRLAELALRRHDGTTSEPTVSAQGQTDSGRQVRDDDPVAAFRRANRRILESTGRHGHEVNTPIPESCNETEATDDEPAWMRRHREALKRASEHTFSV